MVTGSNFTSAEGNSSFTDSIDTSVTDTSSIEASSLLYSSIPDICIGGGSCGGNSKYYQIDLGGQKYIDNIVVYAHDNVGNWNTAHLVAYVDGQSVGRLPVKKVGSFLTFNVGQEGRYVRFYSVHENNDPRGDETVIKTVDVYGN
ncbi:hypothetical protein [Chengkuizengella sediminis]|uniref:hypothetical protein n=1 Tax=Chengkuizengella sediminis TaxID=1885917 RepID=UPI00138944DC|nr:hypothetical protein [Chengkuizengella sediminis]NDI34563.1 hypothetical protein [Chengkuizengella sediminis]